MFSACLPACILYLMHLFCIGFLLLNRLYVLVFEACRDWKMTSFLTLRPALKASSAWTVNIHQVYINLSLFLHPRSSNFRLFVLMIVQRGAILTGRKTNPFYFESFQYLVSFAKSNDHNPMYFWNSHVFPLKLGACSILNNLCSRPFISLKRKKKKLHKASFDVRAFYSAPACLHQCFTKRNPFFFFPVCVCGGGLCRGHCINCIIG